jgi:translation initiation factor IF-2
VAQVLEIDEQVTVGALAELLSIPVSQLISELFRNGIAATVNEKIDFETAQITKSPKKLNLGPRLWP